MSLSVVKVGRSLHRMKVLNKPEVVRMPQIERVRDLTKIFTLSNFVRVMVGGEAVGIMKGLFSKELACVILDCMDASLDQVAQYAESLGEKEAIKVKASASDRKARTQRISSRIDECAAAAAKIAPRDINMILSFLKAEVKNPQGIRLPLQEEVETAFVSPDVPLWPNSSFGEYIFEIVKGECRSIAAQRLYLSLERVVSVPTIGPGSFLHRAIKQPKAQAVEEKADFRLVLGGDVETVEHPYVGFRLAVPWSNLVSL